ncbi:MAG: hypothetical protein ACLRZH_11630 [Ruthenibacterium lactatiformans]
MMERKNADAAAGSRFAGRACLFVLCPCGAGQREEPPEDLPAAVSAQDGAQEETTLPGADAHNRTAPRGPARPTARNHCHVGAGKPALRKTAVGYPVRNAILISIDTGDILYEKSRMPRCPWRLSPRS